ncbi:hypothetical protein ES288_A07G107100v1 [Gossypium darwinii]|uniref:Uncharacterized protein n=1 Tax=Gossypium darwinii TaxID=34276 RepID=A0A5D2FU83_GOSDA|nr:hypothetical protein ES288_A07G107100v1 [Gossypium darwinii]
MTKNKLKFEREPFFFCFLSFPFSPHPLVSLFLARVLRPILAAVVPTPPWVVVKTARDVFRPVSELFKCHVSFSPKTRRKEILLPPLESTLSTEMRLRRRGSGAVQVWSEAWRAEGMGDGMGRLFQVLCTLRPAHGGSGARLVELGFELLKSFKIVGLGF